MPPSGSRAGAVVLVDDTPEGEGAAGLSLSKTGVEPVHRVRQNDRSNAKAVTALANLMAPIDVQLRDLQNALVNERVEPGHALIGAIMGLARSGYTLDQIAEAMVLGTGGYVQRDPGDSAGTFQGQANGLGVDGKLKNVVVSANVPQ